LVSSGQETRALAEGRERGVTEALVVGSLIVSGVALLAAPLMRLLEMGDEVRGLGRGTGPAYQSVAGVLLLALCVVPVYAAVLCVLALFGLLF
jgi:hypothetical protein